MTLATLITKILEANRANRGGDVMSLQHAWAWNNVARMNKGLIREIIRKHV